MPHISQMKNSNYLSQGDCAQGPLLATIARLTQETVGKGQEAEEKWILHFSNIEKPMVLNWTNTESIARITGSEDTDNWGGKQIVIYYDPNVSFGGKITGGLRVRAPKVKTQPSTFTPPAPRPAPKPAAPPPPPADAPAPEEDDVPF